MKNKELLAIDNRSKIFTTIKKHPCIHLAELSRITKLSEGTIRHHIRFLKKHDMINQLNENGYSRYFIKDVISRDEKDVLSVIHNPVVRNIILYLLIMVAASQHELSHALKKNPSTITFHLKKLKEKNIIQPAIIEDGKAGIGYEKIEYMKCKNEGRKVVYKLSDNVIVYKLLITHQNKFFDKGFTKDLLKYFEFWHLNKKIKTYGDTKIEDNLVDLLLEVFPHPYHG